MIVPGEPAVLSPGAEQWHAMSVQKAILVELFAILLMLYALVAGMDFFGFPNVVAWFGLLIGGLALLYGLVAENWET